MNKNIMTLFRDFLIILSCAERAASFSTLNEILGKEKLSPIKEAIDIWNQIHLDREEYSKELEFYKANLLHNPSVNQSIAISKLVSYKNRTIQGLKVIKKHAIHAKNSKEMNNIVNELRESCNVLLEIIRDELYDTSIIKQRDYINIYELNDISLSDITS
jgi:hypothetical protein